MKLKYANFFRFVLIMSIIVGAVFQPQTPAYAAVTTVTPITWNIIGLDSNNVSVGPNLFPVGARVCANAAGSITVNFVWDDGLGVFKSSPSADPYINLRDGTNSSLTLIFTGSGCQDAYFEVEVNRDSNAYNNVRRYHITAGGVSTPTPRELFVEHLISQSRNSVTSLRYGPHSGSLATVDPGGTMSLLVGQEYDIEVVSQTATNGYEQSETFISLPNTIFQLLSVSSDYSADTSSNVPDPNDRLYGDACNAWEANPLSPNYPSCQSTGKVGGTITQVYHVKILTVPGSPLVNPEPLSTLIYDYSGSSFHYNADFGVSTRFAYIIDYSSLGFKKKFTPASIQPNGTSTLTLTITNPFNIQLNGVQFTDPLPSTTTPATQMVVASTPSASTSGCGSPTFSPAANATSLTFTGGTLYPNGTCTITVNVTAPGNGTTDLSYPNTTNSLYLDNGATNTNKTASATLTVGTVVSKPSLLSSCTPSATALATWSFENAGAPATPSANASDVSINPTYTYGALDSMGLATSGLSTVTAHSTTHSWSGQNNATTGWLTTGSTVTATSAPHFDFLVDTRRYAFVRINYWYDLEGTAGAWSSNNDSFYVYTSNDGGTTWVAANSPTDSTTKGKWTQSGTMIASTSGGVDNTGALTTIFRIIPVGVRSGGSANAITYLDDVSITGCVLPNPPTITKSFLTDPVKVNDTPTLRFTITNPSGNTSSLSGIAFEDNLPAGLNVTSGTTNFVCTNGTLTLTAASGDTPAKIALTGGGSLSTGSSCNIDITVTAGSNSVFNNVSGYVSATQSGGNTTSTGFATDTLTAYLPPQITKTYASDSILTGGTSKLTYVITNPNAFNSLTGINFSDTYAGTMTNTSTLNINANTCGITPTASGGGTSFAVASSQNMTLAAGASCTITVDVTATTASTTPVAITSGTTVYATGTSGSTGATGALSLTGNTASDTLYVKALVGALKLSKQVSASSSGPWFSNVTLIPAGSSVYYRFVVENTGDIALTGVHITDALVSTSSCSWPSPLPVANAGGTEVATCVVGPITPTSAGYVTNTAQAFGTNISTDDVASNTDKATYQNGNFGHLPSAYTNMNLFNDGGAFQLNGSTYLGSSVTTNATDGINTATYTPKATDNGITWTGTWASGTGSASVTATCSPAGNRTLYGWFDWNNDKDFSDTNEVQNWTVNCSPSGTANTISITYPGGANLAAGTYYTRFRIYDVAPTNPQPYSIAKDASGNPIVGEIEDPILISNGGPNPTPVTLSYFSAERRGGNVDFDWSTSTETGNMGFNLYVDADGQLIQINPELIVSTVVDSLERQDYTYSAKVSGNTFYIEDVSLQGVIKRHGPFQVGQVYGERLELQPIDQAAIEREVKQSASVRQAELRKDMAVPATARQEPVSGSWKAQLSNTINLKVTQTGIQRVSYEMLRDAGLDLNGVPAPKITVLNRGQMVPVSLEVRGKFGPGSYLEFYGEALDTLYTDTNVYTVQVIQTSADRAKLENAAPKPNVQPSSYYMETLLVNNQNRYTPSLSVLDPWYDTLMQVGTTPKTWNFSFEVSSLVDTTPACISMLFLGLTDPQTNFVLSVNGSKLSAVSYTGAGEYELNAELPVGVLHEGVNTLTLTVSSSAPAGVVLMDKYSLIYPRAFQAKDGRLTFTAAGEVFTVNNLAGKDVLVYRLDPSGPVRLSQVRVQAVGGAYAASFAGAKEARTYLVTTVGALIQPRLEAVRALVNLDSPADYLIISHPHFMDGLAPLVAARRAEGLTVSVVNVEDLYTQYSYGIFDPQAIKSYIAYAAENLRTRYVLLVGGDTRDYRNYSKQGQISFLPSLYIRTGPTVGAVPADPLYTDLTGDNLPDLAIGRFPVHTQAELVLMIQKTLAYQDKGYGRTAVFATDQRDPIVSFKEISRGMELSMPSGWMVEGLHLDDLAVATARQRLIASINRGTALVTFTGHSDATRWASANLFNVTDAAQLTNAGRPFVAVQWGCWNTYYVNPSSVYLYDRLLFAGNKGAAAVLGAVTQTDARSEQLLGGLLTPRMVQSGVRIGDALQESKAELSQTHPELLDVLLGWTLMGDPALVIEP